MRRKIIPTTLISAVAMISFWLAWAITSFSSRSGAASAVPLISQPGSNTQFFFFLPPLGTVPPPLTPDALDRSLTDFIKITICKRGADGCNVIGTITATSAIQNPIRLKPDHYVANWKPSGNTLGVTFQIQIDVAGLVLGETSYKRGTLDALPIKFHIRNHPLVRTRVLTARGKTATFIATVLRDEFQLGAPEVARLLRDEYFTALQIGEALRDALATPAQTSADILRKLEFSALQVGEMLKVVYNQGAENVARILLAVGYPLMEVAVVLRDVSGSSPQEAAAIFRRQGFSVVEVGGVLKNIYSQLSPDAARILYGIGYQLSEVAKALKEVFREDATKISQIFQEVLGITDAATINAALLAAGFTRQETHLAVTPLLIAKYAPIIHFEASEKYLMSSVDWYLERSVLATDLSNYPEVSVPNTAELVTKAGLLKAEGATKLWLKPGNREATKPGNLASAKAYIHVYHPPGVTNQFDLQFWYFYPFNGPGRIYTRIGALWDQDSEIGPLGEHVGDWEAVILRFSDVSLEPEAAYLSQHGAFPRFDWVSAYLEQETHLKVYASRNGHAHYLEVGDNADRKKDIDFGVGHFSVDLYNVTSNGGQQFEAHTLNRYQIVAAEKLPIKGSEWIAFAGRWGPEEELHVDRTKLVDVIYRHLWPGELVLFGGCALICTPLNVICVGACEGIMHSALFALVLTTRDEIVDLFAKDERTSNGPVSPAYNEKCDKNGYSVWFYKKDPKESDKCP